METIEKALFITTIKNLKSITPTYNRLYFGNEFCEKLIPTPNELEEIVMHCDKNKLSFSLVTPYVTNSGLGKLEKLFRWLRKNKTNCEVIINDYGVLDLINEKHRVLRPVLGRLLTKQKRDPRILNLIKREPKAHVFFKRDDQYSLILAKKIPNTLVSYFKETNINVPVIQNFLKKCRVGRIEIDNLLQGINLRIPKKDFCASLYIPYGYITTTRLCSANPFRVAKKFFCKISHCKKECKLYTLKLRNKYLPVTYKKGNTVFFKNSKIPSVKELIEKGINRIVYQPEIPL
jgi:hypothetical protein